jgi:hypothetical protein
MGDASDLEDGGRVPGQLEEEYPPIPVGTSTRTSRPDGPPSRLRLLGDIGVI